MHNYCRQENIRLRPSGQEYLSFIYVSSQRHDPPTVRAYRFQRFSNSGTYRCTQRRIVDGQPVVIQTGGLVVQGRAAWSADSSELVFSAQESSREHAIYRVARSGEAPKRIAGCMARGENGCELDWSPDGRGLAVADRSTGRSVLYLLDLASGRRRE